MSFGMNVETKKKKVIIIGAGISGLTSGVYLLYNSFDVVIYEKNNIPQENAQNMKEKIYTLMVVLIGL